MEERAWALYELLLKKEFNPKEKRKLLLDYVRESKLHLPGGKSFRQNPKELSPSEFRIGDWRGMKNFEGMFKSTTIAEHRKCRGFCTPDGEDAVCIAGYIHEKHSTPEKLLVFSPMIEGRGLTELRSDSFVNSLIIPGYWEYASDHPSLYINLGYKPYSFEEP